MHFLVKLVCAAPCRFWAAAWSLQHFFAKLVKAAPCKFLPVAWTLQLSSANAGGGDETNRDENKCDCLHFPLPRLNS